MHGACFAASLGTEAKLNKGSRGSEEVQEAKAGGRAWIRGAGSVVDLGVPEVLPFFRRCNRKWGLSFWLK